MLISHMVPNQTFKNIQTYNRSGRPKEYDKTKNRMRFCYSKMFKIHCELIIKIDQIA